ncbi:PE-PPE domain-containing protein [Mycolicibacterium moriokaense]|nr:PE-PPE domain-containing protein [Mycolicibacterium moriokaense]
MAGKHRKHSEVRTTVAKRGGSGVAAAALSITGLGTAVVTGTTAAVAPNVQLMALVSAANSTSQFFAGSSYYGTDWTDVYGTQQVVPFYQGPQGIADAIASHQTDTEKTGVTASGWGAGQAGTALGIAAANGDLDNVGLVILDNNTNRAGGGFWTTYYPFAPLLGTTADPTPTDLPDGVTVLDVGYEYNINGDAPVDPLNPFALGNSLMAYAYGYGQESSALDITQDESTGVLTLHQANGEDQILEPGTHYVVKDGNVVETYPAGDQNSTVFVTVDSGDLPLTRPLRLLPGGDIIANAVDPLMTDLVDAGYADGKGTADNPAIPEDPTVTRPMKPFSSLSALSAGGLQVDVQEGLQAGQDTATADIANPTNFITKPLGEAAKLPGISTLTNAVASTSSTNSTLKTTQTNGSPLTSGNSLLSGLKKPSLGSTSTASTPGQKFSDRVNDAVSKVTGGLTKNKTESNNDN